MSATRPSAPSLPRGDVNTNPTGISFWALVAEDFRTNDRSLGSQGFWALFWHRFGNWRMSVRPRAARIPLTVLYRLMFKICELLGGIKLSYNCPVGRRVKLDHAGGGMVLGARSIGSDVLVHPNATLGIASARDPDAKPTIADGVEIGTER